jgi:hypothetical protein
MVKKKIAGITITTKTEERKDKGTEIENGEKQFDLQINVEDEEKTEKDRDDEGSNFEITEITDWCDS